MWGRKKKLRAYKRDAQDSRARSPFLRVSNMVFHIIAVRCPPSTKLSLLEQNLELCNATRSFEAVDEILKYNYLMTATEQYLPMVWLALVVIIALWIVINWYLCTVLTSWAGLATRNLIVVVDSYTKGSISHIWVTGTSLIYREIAQPQKH